MLDNQPAVATSADTQLVAMSRKEYESWLAIKAAAERTQGKYGFVLVRFANGHILVHNVNTQPERVR